MKYLYSFCFLFLLQTISCKETQKNTFQTNTLEKKTDSHTPPPPPKIRPAAERIDTYLPLLKNKKIALAINHTSLVDGVSLADTLKSLQVDIRKIFAPEHGFRGTAGAGEKVNHGIDSQTGISITSLYGKRKKPLPEDLKGIEIVLFDIQDVGVRFYTYISTMTYIMEACAEQNIEVLILDRPNPNGHYIAGPILEKEHSSFIGLHTVPIVHGMTIAEYAQMVNGEGWLANGKTCKLSYILCENYTHQSFYELPVKPSPNLRTMKSIYMYPFLCLFEGTVMSVGRGTDKPFTIFGAPDYPAGEYEFTPVSTEGATNPLYEGKTCKGYDLSALSEDSLRRIQQISLDYLIRSYKNYPNKNTFFNPTFTLLAGNKSLEQAIKAGKTAEEIYASWDEGLKAFAALREKYLLYKK